MYLQVGLPLSQLKVVDLVVRVKRLRSFRMDLVVVEFISALAEAGTELAQEEPRGMALNIRARVQRQVQPTHALAHFRDRTA